MHQVQTLNPDCTHRPRALHLGSTHSAVSQAQHQPCRRPGWPCRALYRRAPRTRCCSYRSFLRRIVALPPAMSRLYHDTTQQPSRVPITIRPFVSRHNPSAARTSRARRLPLRAGRPCRTWRRLGRIVGESWPCRGPQAMPRPHLPSPVSRYNPLYRDSNGQ